MLRYRALTWALLIIFVVWGIFSLPPIGFTVIMSFFWLGAVWEWTELLKIASSLKKRSIFIFGIFLLSILAYFYFSNIMLVLGVLTWLGALILIFRFPHITVLYEQNIFLKFILGVLMLSPCWVGLNLIRNYPNGLIYVLFILSLIWIVDTLGYLVGKPWRRHKLAPHLSPGKSIEGVLGGVFFTFLFSVMIIYSDAIPFKRTLTTVLLTILIALFSVIGDLFESLLKRQAHVKDSGKLLPGHGGLLDRMDSTLAAVPLFTLFLPFIARI